MSREYKPLNINRLEQIIVFNGDGDTINFYREGKYIYLKKVGEENKRYYRFNLQTSKFERINIYKTVDTKITEVPTRNITQWFKDCRLVTHDIHFGRLVIFAKYNRRFDKYSSPVRFVEQLGSPIITNIEKWESLGMRVEEIERFFSDHLVSNNRWQGHTDNRINIYTGTVPRDFRSFFSGSLTYAPSDFNKETLNHILDTYEEIDDYTLRQIHNNYNNGEEKVEKTLENICANPEFADSLDYISEQYGSRGVQKNLLDSDSRSFHMKMSVIHLIQEFNLEPHALLRFFKRQRNVENNGLEYLINANHYRDYLRCELALKDGSLRKMNKYPNNFRTIFHNVQSEYNAKKASIDKGMFKYHQDKKDKLAHVGRKFIIHVPKDPYEIDVEAAELEHCVRTYIPRVVKGETSILFLRLKAYPDQPYVTLEVKRGVLNQAYGKNDSKPDSEALEFLKSWIKKKDIKAGCWTSELT